jgi:hypothetical protein
LSWHLELACFNFDIIYCPGSENVPADTLSRISAGVSLGTDLGALHVALCHPGITRMSHWDRAKNLPFSIEDVEKVINSCPVCAELKPHFNKHEGNLIKAVSPFERLNLDFKSPMPVKTRSQYLLTITDKFSRFSAALCADVSTATVIRHLSCFHIWNACIHTFG